MRLNQRIKLNICSLKRNFQSRTIKPGGQETKCDPAPFNGDGIRNTNLKAFTSDASLKYKWICFLWAKARAIDSKEELDGLRAE